MQVKSLVMMKFGVVAAAAALAAGCSIMAVSYTHLTLPTNREV